MAWLFWTLVLNILPIPFIGCGLILFLFFYFHFLRHKGSRTQRHLLEANYKGGPTTTHVVLASPTHPWCRCCPSAAPCDWCCASPPQSAGMLTQNARLLCALWPHTLRGNGTSSSSTIIIKGTTSSPPPTALIEGDTRDSSSTGVDCHEFSCLPQKYHTFAKKFVTQKAGENLKPI